MLRRTFVSRVHLFSALVPNARPGGDSFLTPEQLQTAKAAVAERRDILAAADFDKCLDSLHKIKDARQRHDLIRSFSGIVDAYRAELYKKTTVDPSHRLQLHEAIMAAGFYQRAVSTSELQGESTRFVLNHYNFDVRRDVAVTKLAHDTLQASKDSTLESDRLLEDLLLLERRLSGKYRLAPTAGRSWLVLGQPVAELATEEELHRVLELAPIKAHGNFSLSEADTEKLWKTATVAANAEAVKCFVEEAGMDAGMKEADIRYDLRIEKPKAPLSFWEELTDKLLRYWVIWLSIWITFWMVDEEIITLIALIVLKARQTSILEAEAERTGGKVYIATSTGRAV